MTHDVDMKVMVSIPGIPQLTADYLSICVPPRVITHSAPSTIDIHLHSSLVD